MNVKLDYDKIVTVIWKSNNANGEYLLAIDPTDGETRICWHEATAPWASWPDGWITAEIPALFPDGSGRETDEMREFVINDARGEDEDVEEAVRNDETSWREEIEKRGLTELWNEQCKEAASWLADEWLAELNGDPNDADLDGWPFGVGVDRPEMEFSY